MPTFLRAVSLRHVAIIFIVAFLCNVLWEEAHHVLYLHYHGEVITHVILFRAALVDAVFIVTAYVTSRLLKKPYLFFVITFFVALFIEWWALATGRWAYTISMPLVPFLGVGLSPLVQLTVTGFISQKILFWVSRFLKGAVIG
jgi:hypothetical protein